MNMVKEMIEKELGCEISSFKLEPIYENGNCIGLNVLVDSKSKLDFIEHKITIQPTKNSNF